MFAKLPVLNRIKFDSLELPGCQTSVHVPIAFDHGKLS